MTQTATKSATPTATICKKFCLLVAVKIPLWNEGVAGVSPTG